MDGDGTINCLDACPNDCSPLGRSCTSGELRQCVINSSGCRVRTSSSCQSGFCFDDTHCGRTTSYQWNAGGFHWPVAVAMDADGNSYASGITSVGLDGNTFAGGGYDAFFTKWSASGQRLWTVQMGTGGWEYAEDLMVSPDSARVAVVGGIRGTDFDIWVGLWPTAARGAPLWLEEHASSAGANDFPQAIAYGPGGDLYITGGTEGQFATQTAAGGMDAFLMRVRATDGGIVWTRQWGSAVRDEALAIAADSTHVYTAGYSGRPTSDSYEAGLAFLRKYTPVGALVWERTWDFGVFTDVQSAVFDGQGGIVVGGFSAADDQLLSRVSVNHALLWTRDDYASALAAATDGTTYGTWDNEVHKRSLSGERIWSATITTMGDLTDVAVGRSGGELLVVTTGSYDDRMTGRFDITRAEQ